MSTTYPRCNECISPYKTSQKRQVNILKLTEIFILKLVFFFSIRVIKPMQIDEMYSEIKNQVIKAERRILKELGFCVHVKHPHKVC